MTLRIKWTGEPLPPPQIVIEEVTDPAVIARSAKAFEQADRNMNWLQTHWPELVPGVLGQFLAVAGQEAFIADSSEKATAMLGNGWAASWDGEECESVSNLEMDASGGGIART